MLKIANFPSVFDIELPKRIPFLLPTTASFF
jgi:hypothetical protein